MGNIYAIYRVAKIKTLIDLKARSGHDMRTHETLNADAFLTLFNSILKGSGEPAADAEARLAILTTPPHRNSVGAWTRCSSPRRNISGQDERIWRSSMTRIDWTPSSNKSRTNTGLPFRFST